MAKLGKYFLVFLLFFLPLSIYGSKKPILLFVHGLAAGFEKWQPLIEDSFPSHNTMRFSDDVNIVYQRTYDAKDGFDVWNVSYYTHNIAAEMMFGHLDLYAKRLEQICRYITHLTGNSRFRIIAHSMGGLVSRKMMTLSQKNWDSVEKILTVGTPHHGVDITLGVWGQLYDLNSKNDFISQLNEDWLKYPDYNRKWGVIGAINKKKLNVLKSPKFLTDSGGPGFVTIDSSIPFGEWKLAINMMNIPVYNTDYFGFRLATFGTHMGLLEHHATTIGLQWVLND